jgi:hypothetical protein
MANFHRCFSFCASQNSLALLEKGEYKLLPVWNPARTAEVAKSRTLIAEIL